MARNHVRRMFENMVVDSFVDDQNGRESVELLNQNMVDFVVTDYNMPEMDGQTLVDNIRNSSNQSSVPVLMVTSEEDENRLSAVQQMGVSAICDKPFEPKTLRYLLMQIMADNPV